jgi:Na+-transporting methylmalonyl-CoA/oxaloacetate decarboxylase gamma subunit
MWVLPFCSLYFSFFFGCFDLFMIGKVSSFFEQKSIKKDLNSQCKAHDRQRQHKLRPILTCSLHIHQRVGKHGK